MTKLNDNESSTDSPAFVIQKESGETDQEALARVFLAPELQSALTISQFAKGGFSAVNLSDLVVTLEKQRSRLVSGDTQQCEATLVAHVATLDFVFHQLLQRAFLNIGEFFETAETYMKLALRAQSQCRATTESLAAMKQPPTEVIRQTNIARGHQQVNNFPQNELLEGEDGERLDTGKATAAVRGDQAMETVGEKHWA